MDPMAGGMGGPPGGPPGGDPMGGGMGGPPPGGAAPTPPEPQPIPQHADVWDVLDSILGHHPIEQEKQLKKYKSQQAELSSQNSPPPPGTSSGNGFWWPRQCIDELMSLLTEGRSVRMP